MIKRNSILFSLLFAMMLMYGCEPTNPFATGPIYDSEANLAIDRVKIDEYLKTAEIDSVRRIHDPSGVIIIVQVEGVGSRPTGGTVVYTDYTGSLISDGSVFDTTSEQVARDNDIYVETATYEILKFTLGTGQVIQGWDIGYRRLRPGSKAVLIIPSPYAYRNQKINERIPENSILRFDIDFRGID
ncbi:FKBP-type peptidyl-prolyl cis-trans isomerase FkpA [Algoriphagus ornithinivorans]|uniref:Peptidyl-prolyl cis-trans isomerase n=1 Tax=Algoriphagus ornithinivorans TaxID=226506 RepID=A0A1I5E9P3_9BACT|nr:FKBP-type peptidyl-prolyl cis-trans isomerase [Algoriphagus ornithinivorans]SFO07986.1 FKBP-type peptidyl-prolyl cis-trans isomerase FkpA [Algoriphagus ornithinivorans]